MLSKTHNGVLIPTDMQDASVVELDAYASDVKVGNRKFIDAHFALEDAAIAHRTRKGYAAQDSRTLLADLLARHEGDNLVHALVYNGFATENAAQRLGVEMGA